MCMNGFQLNQTYVNLLYAKLRLHTYKHILVSNLMPINNQFVFIVPLMKK